MLGLQLAACVTQTRANKHTISRPSGRSGTFETCECGERCIADKNCQVANRGGAADDASVLHRKSEGQGRFKVQTAYEL